MRTPKTTSLSPVETLRPAWTWLHHVGRTSLVLVLSALVAVPALPQERVTYFHNDALGSPVAATDEDGDLLWTESYLPYGERVERSVSTDEHAAFYTGKPHDDVTGLTYLGARDYDPVLGRFMGMDPVGFATGNVQSFNKYAYANNNPYRFVDPNGESATLAFYTLVIVSVLVVGLSISQQTARNNSGDFGTRRPLFPGGIFMGGSSGSGAGTLTGGTGDPCASFDCDEDVSDGDYSPVPESYMNPRIWVDMRNAPRSSGRNAAGHPVNGPWFWRQMLRKHPEFFDDANRALIRRGSAPKVNDRWVTHFPKHEAFSGDKLVHHHMGQGRFATPLPQRLHKKYDRSLHPNQGKRKR